MLYEIKPLEWYSTGVGDDSRADAFGIRGFYTVCAVPTVDESTVWCYHIGSDRRYFCSSYRLATAKCEVEYLGSIKSSLITVTE